MDASCHHPPFTKTSGDPNCPIVGPFQSCLLGSGLAKTAYKGKGKRLICTGSRVQEGIRVLSKS